MAQFIQPSPSYATAVCSTQVFIREMPGRGVPIEHAKVGRDASRVDILRTKTFAPFHRELIVTQRISYLDQVFHTRPISTSFHMYPQP